MAKCGDSRAMFREWRDSIKSSYTSLKKQDQNDPLVKAELAYVSRMYSLLNKVDSDMLNDPKYRKSIEGTVNNIKEAIYGAQEDANDPLTKRFRERFGGLVSVVSRGKRKETIKRVEYKDGNVHITVYPEKVSEDVKTYVFAIGSDTGRADELLTPSYEVNVRGLGEFTKSLRDVNVLLGSSDINVEALRTSRAKVDDYVHGNVNNMLSIVDRLVSDKDSDSYVNYVKSLIQDMDPNAFKEMELFLGRVDGTDSTGFMTANSIEVYENSDNSPARGRLSKLGVYVHEVVHSMTAFGFNADKNNTRRLWTELNTLVKDAKSQLTVEDLYPVNATKEEMGIAKELYDYIFNNEKGVDIGNQEFMVHAVTNPQLMLALSRLDVTQEVEKGERTFLQKLSDLFHKMVRIVFGELSTADVNSDMYTHAVNLMNKFAEINKVKPEDKGGVRKAVEYAGDLVNRVDSYAAEMIEAGKDKVVGNELLPKYPENGSKVDKAMYLMKYLGKSLTHEEYRKAAGLVLSSYGLKPNSSIREIVGGFFQKNTLTKNVEWLGLAAGRIDTARESVVNTVKAMVIEGFDEGLTAAHESAVTRLLVDTDASTLYKIHGMEKLREFIENDSAIDSRLSILKNNLKKIDSDNYNWLEAQAFGLGRYMATHRGHIAQNMNSYAIAKGAMSDSNIVYSKDLENLISEMASLQALKMSKEGRVDLVKELSNEGIANVLEMYESFKNNSNETVMKNAEMLRVQGYTTELFDDGIDIEVHPVNRKDVLEREGLKLVREFDRINKKGDRLGLYVSNKYHRPERLRGATKLLSQKAKGTTLKSVVARNSLIPLREYVMEKEALDNERNKLTKQMKKGKLDLESITENMLPLLDGKGNVVDYRYAMDKPSKEQLLEQDTRISEVLGRSNGHLLDKVYSEEHNQKVLEVIKQDMEENWGGGNVSELVEYTILNPKSDKQELVDLYNLLPKEFKEYAESREDGSIAVPTYLKDMYFGYPHLSLVANKYSKHLPKWFNQVVGMAEQLWMDIVKIAKGNILLKTPVVLIANLWSNFWYMLVQGHSPLEIMKDYVTSFRDVRSYVKNNREILRLEYELRGVREKQQTAEVKRSIKEKEWKLGRLKHQNEINPVKELVDAGLYQTIVEDVEVRVLEGKTVWDKLANKVFGKLPKQTREGFDILYLNQSTTWYKFNQEVLQMSDLIARDVQNKRTKARDERIARGELLPPSWWVKEKEWGKDRKISNKAEAEEFMNKAKNVRLYTLLETYVNYTKPSGRGEEYLNRVGLLMFTKYAKRIQRIIVNQGSNHPIKTTLSLLIDQGLLNVDTIQDQSILSKEWHTNSHGPGNFYPIYNPLEVLEMVITPSLLKESTWSFLPI